MFNNNYGTTVFFLILKKKFGHTQLQKKRWKWHIVHIVYSGIKMGNWSWISQLMFLTRMLLPPPYETTFFPSEALNHKYHQLVKGPAQEVCAFFSLCSVGSPTSLNPCGLNLPSGWSGNTSVLPSLRNNWASGLRLATFMSRPNVARIVFSLPILLIIIVHYYLNGIFLSINEYPN